MFFGGVIDNRKNKIYVLSGGISGPNSQRMPAIQCVQGSYPGQVFNLQNVEFSMGSQQGVNLVIPDTHVSRCLLYTSTSRPSSNASSAGKSQSGDSQFSAINGSGSKRSSSASFATLN